MMMKLLISTSQGVSFWRNGKCVGCQLIWTKRVETAIPPGVFEMKDTSKNLCRSQKNVTVDSNTLKTKPYINEGFYVSQRFVFKTFLNTILSFLPNIVHEPDKNQFVEKSICTIERDKVPLKCDCFDEFEINGGREPIFFCFVFEKPPGYEIFCEPDTIHFKKVIKTVWTIITFTWNGPTTTLRRRELISMVKEWGLL